jgi:hypothetical protein
VTPSVPYTEQNDDAEQTGVLAIHAVHFPIGEGKILTWRGRLDQRMFDVATGAWEWYPLTRGANSSPCNVPDENAVDGDIDLFCAGQTLLADGTVITSGGNITGNIGDTETDRPSCVNTLDPFSAQPVTPTPDSYDPSIDPMPMTAWGSVDPSNHSRWYPSVTQLDDDRVLMTGGGNNMMEMLTGSAWADVAERPQPMADALLAMPTYPSMYLLPDGNVAYTGSEDAVGSDTTTRSAFVFDPEASAWTDVEIEPSVQFGPTGGYAVMYAPGLVMRASGGSDTTIEENCEGNFPNVVTEVLDLSNSDYLNDDTLTWRRVGDMAFARHFHNLVILADGTVMAVGGNECDNGQSHHEADAIEEFAVRTAELWDPQSETWCELATQDRPRMYHSTALLLKDGRVISMAGGRRQGMSNQENAEIFTPPYLLTGNAQPQLGIVAPDPIPYGTDFVVNLNPDSPVGWDEISRFTLIRLAATTHGFDQSQRFMDLGGIVGDPISDTAALVHAPDTPREMPPGWYMLFAISDAGVPSAAAYVRLAGGSGGGGRLGSRR